MKPWKLQKFVGDIVWDLRNRGLLPIAALLGVAMVVVPVVISRSGGEAPPPASQSAAEGVAAPENEVAVLAYSPGVRNYRKRLEALQAKDPFKQHFSGSTAGSASLGEELAVTVGGGSDVGTADVSVGDGSSGSGGGGGEATSRTVVRTKYVSYRLDVAVGETGALERRNSVSQLSFLPSESTPVLVFLGIGGEGSKALFLVSSDVSAVSGEGACMPSSSSPCEVLVLRPGQVKSLTYDPDGKVYRVRVLAIKRSTKTVNGG